MSEKYKETEERKEALGRLGYTEESFAEAKNKKQLDKLRSGKSKAFGWLLGIGIAMTLATMGAASFKQTIEYASLAFCCYLGAVIAKVTSNKKAKRIRTYESMVNKNGNTSIYDLAAAAGRPVSKAADDLQLMISQGFFKGAYLDMENMLVVMTKDGEAIESVEESAAASKSARRKAARAKGLVPESVEDLLLTTDDKEIKEKLQALQSVMDKIEARVAEKPEMEKDVKEYNEKFYPEVVRLTDDYNEKIAKLNTVEEKTEDGTEIKLKEDSIEKQAIDIKKELIKMIDNVIEASDNLLEKMHEQEMMDISSDIKSVETTIASKGLLDSDFDVKI